MNKKILIFHPYLAPYRIDLYNRLSENFNLFVLLTGNKKEIGSLGFDIFSVNKQSRFNYKYITKGIWIGRHLLSSIYIRIINTFKPDIVITHELGINTLCAIIARKIGFKFKLYTTVDDSPEMASNYSFKRKLLRQFVSNNIDNFIVISEDVANIVKLKTNKKPICFPIIQDNKVFETKLGNIQHKAETVIQQYNLTNKKIVLFVGRLEPCKAPDFVLKEFCKLDIKDSILVIIGDGSLYSEIKKTIENNNIKNVILTGKLFNDDLYVWYYLSHIFVLPSRFEPFGAVVNEALISGCRTIVSNKVGASCLINESNGCIFELKDDVLKDILYKELSEISLYKTHKSLMNRDFTSYYNELITYITK